MPTDERLDAVLGHMHSIGPRASGTTGDDSTLMALSDAIAGFSPITSWSHCAAQSTPIGRSED
jgi:hypothetical protein